MLFGFARESAINSRSVVTLSSLDTTTTKGPAPTSPIGSRSFKGSYGSFLPLAALVVIEVEANSSV